MPVLYSSQRTAVRGFTLLEMLVVMVLIGLVTGVVFPTLSNWFDTLVVRSELSQVQSQLRRLPAWASLAHQRVRIGPPESSREAGVGPASYLAVGVPEGWSLHANWALESGQWVVHGSGLCEAGTLVLRQRARQRSYSAALLGAGCEMTFAELPQGGTL
jgi:prepilin-type N-terminal cleavage/methylation domain-containing protein